MNTKPLVYGLSAVAVVLGLLFLISTISAPSQDPVIFARDLVTSVLAIALGVLAPHPHQAVHQRIVSGNPPHFSGNILITAPSTPP